MVKRKKASKKAVAAAKNANDESTAGAAESTVPSAAVGSPTKRAAKKVARKKRAARRKVGRPRTSKAAAAKRTSKRPRFSPAERQRILAAAKREGMTGAQVAKRFGISTVTYYLWRKKTGSGSVRRERVTGRQDGVAGNLAELVRRQVREQIQRMLPEIVRGELAGALGESRRR